MAELETNKKLICKFKRLIDNDDGRRHGLLNRINIMFAGSRTRLVNSRTNQGLWRPE